ncbi:helix-turn-helix domain-containing protein [Lysinibacillus sp. MHQ-1]|nr:helix-turn-helix domain-containing protein [Lysinibacillus sp. MHQ-1]
MLSQIENEKAKPSMESLDYIAERLGVKASELLEEVAPSSIRSLLEQVEILFAEVKWGDIVRYQEIVDLIKPSVEGLPHSYEAGRLLYIYAVTQYEAGLTSWETSLLQARTIFKEINLLSHWFKTFILQMSILAGKRQYDLAYACILQAQEIIKQEDYQLDSRDALLMAYYTSILQLAIGEHEEGKKINKRDDYECS